MVFCIFGEAEEDLFEAALASLELTEANIIASLGALHDATEPFGPDGIYGQYLTYMLVALPIGANRNEDDP